MSLKNKLASIVLIGGDVLIFYSSLFWALLIREGYPLCCVWFWQMAGAFSVVLLSWLIVFGISHIYELRFWSNTRRLEKTVIKLIVATIVLAILILYTFFPSLTPKIILLLFITIFWLASTLWHFCFNGLLKISPQKIVIVSRSSHKEELIEFLKQHPQLGYRVEQVFSELPQDIKSLSIASQEKILLVVDRDMLGAESATLKDLLFKVDVKNFRDFYLDILQKIPQDLLDDQWFIQLPALPSYYLVLKRITDIIGGVLLLLVVSPLWLIISALIKLTSSGPVIYKSVRIKQNNKSFYIYKFRTMVKDADQKGPAWTLANDSRITKLGKRLRHWHLDEIPQVINILKGDISFVGPRPEEQKLSKTFQEKIPFYDYRFLMVPGVIGWAQTNYPHGSSLGDTRRKLEYDFYYLKYRSLLLDWIIAIKAWRIPFEIKTH